MISVMQGSDTAAAQDALSILQTVSSDARYKERLQTLIDQEQKANDAIANLGAVQKNSEQRLAAVESMRAAIEAEAKSIAAETRAKKKELEATETNLAKRENVLAVAKKEHDEAVKRHEDKVASDTRTHEARVYSTTRALNEKEKQVQKLSGHLEMVLEGMKEQHATGIRVFEDLRKQLQGY